MSRRKIFALFLSILAMLGLSGCSGSYIKIPTSVPIELISEQAFIAKPNQKGLKVVVRYPDSIDENIQQFFYNLYKQKCLSKLYNDKSNCGLTSKWMAPHRDAETVVKESLTHTAYYVAEYFLMLEEMLGRGSVALLPSVITENESGKYSLASREKLPPAVMYVDFYTSSGTMFYKPEGGSLTFGNMITPMLSVYTSPEGSPLTGGALAGIRYLCPSSSDASHGEGVLSGKKANYWDYLSGNIDISGNDDISDGKNPRCQSIGNVIMNRPVAANTYLEMPLAFIIMDRELVKSQAKIDRGLEGLSPSRSVLTHYAKLVAEAVGNIDAELAVKADANRWAHYYDKRQSGESLYGDSTSQSDWLLQKFYQVESEYLSGRSHRMAESLMYGPYGDSVRKLMVDELEMIDLRMAAHGKEKMADWGTTAIAFLALGIAAGAGDLGVTQSMSGVMQSQNSIMDSRHKTAMEGQIRLLDMYDENIIPILNEAINLSVNLSGKESIKVSSLSDLRKKLKVFYKKSMN